MRCSIGRATQKYKGATGGADFSDILEAPGDLIYADQNIDAENLPIGTTTGHVLTVIAPGQMDWRAITLSGGAVGNLQDVTTNGPTTTNRVDFLNTLTSLSASGNVLVTGNVTAQKFYGDGTTLSGVAKQSNVVSLEQSNTHIWSNLASNVVRIENLEASNTNIWSNLASNVTRIQNLESNILIQSSGGISGFTTGDIIYASSTNTLTRLPIGAAAEVLTVSGGVPSWQAPSGGGLWSEDGSDIYFDTGYVSIGTNSVQSGYDLTVDGNVYVSRNMKVIDEIDTYKMKAAIFEMKVINVVAEQTDYGRVLL